MIISSTPKKQFGEHGNIQIIYNKQNLGFIHTNNLTYLEKKQNMQLINPNAVLYVAFIGSLAQ